MGTRWNTLDWIAWALVIVGAINWLLIGLFQFDLVGWIFAGAQTDASRIAYTLVGIGGLWQLFGVLNRASAAA